MHVMCTLLDLNAALSASVIPPLPLPNMRRRRPQRRLGMPGPHTKALLEQAAHLPHLLSPSRSLLRCRPPPSSRTATRQRSWNSLPLWLHRQSGPLPPHQPLLGPRRGPPKLHNMQPMQLPLRLLPHLRPRPRQDPIDQMFAGCNIARQVALPSTPRLL